jgi:hypothetical protein
MIKEKGISPNNGQKPKLNAWFRSQNLNYDKRMAEQLGQREAITTPLLYKFPGPETQTARTCLSGWGTWLSFIVSWKMTLCDPENVSACVSHNSRIFCGL